MNRSCADATSSVMLAALLWGSGAAGAAELHLVDDRGGPVEARVSVCFQVELRSECKETASRQGVEMPGGFSSVRIEGEDHGPVSLRREQLSPRPDGSYRIAVPRKAQLRIERAPGETAAGRAVGADRQPVTVSLYPPADETFRDPAFRGVASGPLKIPAGEFIASLSSGSNAPDLQRMTAAPAAQVRLLYHVRPGWSVVVRCRSLALRTAVKGAVVKVAATSGAAGGSRVLAESSSDADGLALFSGVQASLATVTAKHAAYLDAEAQGVVAGAGTFTLREIGLAKGGRVQATVSLHGRPVADARCQLASLDARSWNRQSPYRDVWEGPTNAQGLCRSLAVAAGRYKLRIRVPQGTMPATTAATMQAMRWIDVVDGQDDDEDLALAPSRISGEVRRGQDAAEGYSIHVRPVGDQPAGIVVEDVGAVTSDADGRYEMTLWSPGRYSLYLTSPGGASAAARQMVTVSGDDEQQVDFRLDANPIQGTVVDEAGSPIAAATVALLFTGGGLRVESDAQGRFELDFQAPISGASLVGQKSGYRRTEIPVQLTDDQALPPMTLVLKRAGVGRGVVLSAAGAPIAGAMVASVATTAAGPGLIATAQTDAGGAFTVSSPPGPLQVFVSAPGCPLSFHTLPAVADASAGDAGGAGSDDDGAPSPVVVCPEAPASIEMTLLDEQGRPLAQTGVILRQNGFVVPRPVLAAHLALLGLPAQSDGAGHLVIAGIAPGAYDLFLNVRASESSIAAGISEGFLTSVTLLALANAELRLTFEPGPQGGPPP